MEPGGDFAKKTKRAKHFPKEGFTLLFLKSEYKTSSTPQMNWSHSLSRSTSAPETSLTAGKACMRIRIDTVVFLLVVIPVRFQKVLVRTKGCMRWGVVEMCFCWVCMVAKTVPAHSAGHGQ
ncbi:MAG: hypothetical protein D6818_10790 [Bacteroidetes bacterium]|nr:MAG: hypothetical protein D6818_10790 [Bacteroidota bacterium]